MRFEARPPRSRFIGIKLTPEEESILRDMVRRSGAASTSQFVRELIAAAVAVR